MEIPQIHSIAPAVEPLQPVQPAPTLPELESQSDEGRKGSESPGGTWDPRWDPMAHNWPTTNVWWILVVPPVGISKLAFKHFTIDSLSGSIVRWVNQAT